MKLWDLNLRHLRAAAETGRLGSINAAASAVNLTQPAVTQAIARLEAQLDIALFERRHDGMGRLRAAELFLPRVEAALAHIAAPRVTMAQMRAFTAFAAAGSYAGASEAIGLAQPSLHRAVGDLSIVLKRTLLERRGKGLMLSDAGRRTLRAFRLAQAELEAGLSELERLKGVESGWIKIGAMPLSRARILPAAITAFLRGNPDVQVKVVEGSWNDLIEPLRDGDLDMMIGALRDPAPGEDIVQRALFTDRPAVIGRKGHPLSIGDETNNLMQALAGYPWVISAPGTPLRQQWERMFLDGALPAVPVECGSVITIRQMLIDSDYLTLLSEDQVRVELEAGWLVKIADAPEGLNRTIGVTTRTAWRPTAMQAVFLDILDGLA